LMGFLALGFFMGRLAARMRVVWASVEWYIHCRRVEDGFGNFFEDSIIWYIQTIKSKVKLKGCIFISLYS
jgi:hypothetical protein